MNELATHESVLLGLSQEKLSSGPPLPCSHLTRSSAMVLEYLNFRVKRFVVCDEEAVLWNAENSRGVPQEQGIKTPSAVTSWLRSSEYFDRLIL